MVGFDQLLEVIGSETRLRLIELLCGRARSLSELASNLHVTQQAVMKHLTMLERNGLVQQIKVGKRSRVRKVHALGRPLSVGYVFKNNILCLYIGFNGHGVKSSRNIRELLKSVEYERGLIRMHSKVLANRLRTLVEEDLRKQSEVHNAIKNLKLSPIESIALRCCSAIDSEKLLQEASKAFGMNLNEAVRHIIESQA